MIYVSLITGILGATIAYWLNNHFKWGPILGSALPSLLVGLVFHFFPFQTHYDTMIPVVFFGASFVGMASDKMMGNVIWACIAGAIFGLTFYITGNQFEGYGGLLGTTAGVSCLIILGIRVLGKKFKLS